MKQRIVHLSDLHYGPPFQYALEPILLRDVKALVPELVVVAGDLTQRARKRQFQQASAFLDRLPKPCLVIPGNHDIPVYNPLARLLRPFERYKTYIHPHLDVVLRTEGITAVGLNSVRNWLVDRGALSPAQLRFAEEALRRSPEASLKVLASHHHFVLSPNVHQRPLPERLLSRFADWGVELVLVGHTHLTRVEQRPGGLVLIQSGTATATRWKTLKKRVNSFNLIDVSAKEICVQIHEYASAAQGYGPVAEYRFARNVHRRQNSAIMDAALSAENRGGRFPE